MVASRAQSLVPVTRFFPSREDSKIIRDLVYNESSTTVLVSIKRSLAVHNTSNTLQAITNDQIRLLNICFDNVNLLETSYDRKIGEIQASNLIYTYTDPLQNHIDKKGMKIISIQDHKEIIITYSSQNQDFDKFISPVDRIAGTLRILE
jgi:myo-inositol-1-phosphate synthase